MSSALERRSSLLGHSDSRKSANLHKRLSSVYATTAEPSIVIEIDEALVRAGIAGEATSRCTLDVEGRDDDISDSGVLEDRLEAIIRKAVNQSLFISLKGRRIALVETLYLPLRVKLIIARVLFTYHQPRDLVFYSADVCSLLAVGVTSGIVVNIGYEETTVVPVYDQRPLAAFAQSTKLATKAIRKRLLFLMEGLTSTLTEEDIHSLYALLRCSDKPNTAEEYIIEQDLKTVYGLDDSSIDWMQPSTRKSISLPCWMLTAIPEVLFECRSIYVDTDYRSVSQALTHCYQACNADVRSGINNIIITGELCNVRGLQQRIRDECGLRVLLNEFGPDLAWTGTSIASSLGIEAPSVTLTHFNSTRKLPDWCIHD